MRNVPRYLGYIITVLPRCLSFPAFQKQTFMSILTKDHEALNQGESTIFFFISVVLVLLGGIFAGLTLGLMGQDEVHLRVISSSGSPKERILASKVLNLIGKGKHWVLVTLLLSNVITNETLPIILDRCLGGGWQAIVISTVLIVIFGEIIPQSICVRYGLQVGAWFSPFILGLMYIMYPIVYPISVLLDWILGENHGVIYKKSGLKTLVTLHKTMGVERLTQDEVTIISAVLDLKEKQVREVMVPIENVYTMSYDRILDKNSIEEIFNAGFSRIPIHMPGRPTDFVGMLLVRVLISYDPEDCLPVSEFPLATLPETLPKTSCLNILNYFQEGKSHMCVVSDNPGSSSGTIGIVTLEDVIEELIGEEIVDESDVFVDIHQRIIREQPGPLSKRHITSYLHSICASSSIVSTPERQPLFSPPVQDRLKPSNPALNPLNIDNPYVIVKKHSLYSTPPDYGGCSTTPSRHLPFISDKTRKDIENNDPKTNFMSSVSPLSEMNPRPIPISSKHRSIKNGIIESVITVKGVPKTIIEPTKDWDDSNNEITQNESNSEINQIDNKQYTRCLVSDSPQKLLSRHGNGFKDIINHGSTHSNINI